MRCPSCGANVSAAFCEYCGTKMPVERVETQSINADNVVVNNYYYGQSQTQQQPQQPFAKSMGAGYAAYATHPGPGSALAVSPKSRLIAVLLCFFLGFLGAHRFYAGRYLLGIVFLLTLGFAGIGWFVDLLLALFGRMRDGDRLVISNW